MIVLSFHMLYLKAKGSRPEALFVATMSPVQTYVCDII